jgi:hypothetical protein
MRKKKKVRTISNSDSKKNTSQDQSKKEKQEEILALGNQLVKVIKAQKKTEEKLLALALKRNKNQQKILELKREVLELGGKKHVPKKIREKQEGW